MVTVDLRRNKKQKEFFTKVLKELARHEREIARKEAGAYGPAEGRIRFWHYGGGIRGGKTFVLLAVLCLLCKKYPGSKWYIIRRSWPDLKTSLIPSLKKVLEGRTGLYWRNSHDNFYVQFPNGSRIHFMPENADRDPDMNRFKGLEANGFLLEQMEELRKETFDKCKERAGSWYIENMPPALVFSSFNPTYNWVKDDIYDPHSKGELLAPSHFTEALPSDGDWVTDDQWASWEQMDEESQARYIRGVWNFKIGGAFMYAFDDSRNLGNVTLIPGVPIWLSFDFNVDPMTCVVGQTDGRTFVNIIDEFRQPNSDTYAMCKAIMDKYGHMKGLFQITGDASGNNRSSTVQGHQTQYQIIQKQLVIAAHQFKLLTHNPEIAVSRVFCNSIMEKFPAMKVNPLTCPHLVRDMRFVIIKLNAQGQIAIPKAGMNKLANVDNAKLGHLLDCARYFLHRAVPNWLQIPKS